MKRVGSAKRARLNAHPCRTGENAELLTGEVRQTMTFRSRT